MKKPVLETGLNSQWHSLPCAEVLQQLATDSEKGLALETVQERQEKFGANELERKQQKSAGKRFLQQFNQPLLYILLVAGVVTAFLQDWVDSGVIFGVTLINAIIGFIQESKAENAIAALANSVKTETTVIRNSEKQRIGSQELTLGDIVFLKSGDKVPADLRLVKVTNLQVDESALTGESVPVEKNIEGVDPDTPLAERSNMAYAGSLVTFGQAIGVVVAIANDTETGRISQLINQSKPLVTPLTRKIHKFSHTLLYVVLGLAAFTFAVGIAKSYGWVDMFKAAVALAVSAIPEGLPAVVTITLAIGVSRMADRHTIIRKLPAVETLGSTTVICSDKTGTLTENQMTVQAIYTGNQYYSVTGSGDRIDGEILADTEAINLGNLPALAECLQIGLLCNDSHLENHEGQLSVVGDPTEGALIIAAQKAGLIPTTAAETMPRLAEIPFESQFQYMATLHAPSKAANGSEQIIYLKGSPEVILSRSEQMLNATGECVPLDQPAIEAQVKAMAEQGLRVLAFAKKPRHSQQRSLEHCDVEDQLIFVGLQGSIDPPRQDAISAVRACQSAGIQVKMITGDMPLTASAIARMMHLSPVEDFQTYTGRELSRMDSEELANAAENGVVFARVAPEQKLRLVEALQSKGEIVAMTGDGVNDAPALKQADLGVAMGMNGTDAAKEAADAILTNDNFASIEAAVEEGRTVYQNLRRAISFILPINGGESLTILIGILFGTVLPILPIQILWLNMVSSVALTVPLAFEPKSKHLMEQAPRNPSDPLLSASLIRRIAIVSIINLSITFGAFEWILQTTENVDLARTIAIHSLVSAEIFYLLSISELLPATLAKMKGRQRAISYAPAIGIVATIAAQLLFSQWPLMNQIFYTAPLNFSQMVTCLALGFPMLFVGFFFKKFDPLR